MTLSGATTPGQSGPQSDGNKEVLRIPQSSIITGASLSDCLVSYQGHSLQESYPSAEVQSVYSTALADWANIVTGRELKRKRSLFYSHQVLHSFGLVP